MIRRSIAIVAALAAWSVGGLLLTGCAGFLFSAVIHPFATSGWISSALFALGLGASGAADRRDGLLARVPRVGTQVRPGDGRTVHHRRRHVVHLID